MSSAKQPCQTLPRWLKDNLGQSCLAPLTSQDSAALAAAVQLVALYSFRPHPDVLDAFAKTVRSMQPSCWHLAYHSIAHVLNWEDRARLWLNAGLPPSIRLSRCKFEPSARLDAVPAAV